MKHFAKGKVRKMHDLCHPEGAFKSTKVWTSKHDFEFHITHCHRQLNSHEKFV